MVNKTYRNACNVIDYQIQGYFSDLFLLINVFLKNIQIKVQLTDIMSKKSTKLQVCLIIINVTGS